MKKDIAVWGWWQGQNLGDQWIKKTMNKIFPDADFVDTRFKNLQQYKFVVCGGGGLFINDVPRIWRNAYRKTKYGMIGLGAEFEHNNKDAVRVASHACFFYVRDNYSQNCMHLNNMPKSYDITFYDALKIRQKENHGDNCLLIWRKPDRNMLSNTDFISYQQASYDYYEWEKIIYNNFRNITANDLVEYSDNIFRIVKNSDYVISGRYHGIIAAIQLGIPCIAVDVCPKIRSLMREAGMEELCLKYNEVSLLEEKIHTVKMKYEYYRQLELNYREQAISTIKMQVADSRLQIKKVLEPIKLLHYGHYFFKSNDVIKVMADSLKKSCNAKTIEVKSNVIFNKHLKAVVTTKNGTISIIRPSSLILNALFYRPDCIILNSGGLVIDKIGQWYVNKYKIKLIGLELSDPDVFPYNGQVYADKFDLFYTNAQFSIENQYDHIGIRAGLMGFAASADHHYPIDTVKQKYDVVIVGGCREDRLPIVEELKRHFKVGVYGSGWDDGLGFVSGRQQVEAINSGKLYLSFSKTMAGYNNIKVGLFEAVACRCCVITEYMDELKIYFDIGKEILCYEGIEDLLEKINYYLVHEDEREKIAESGYQKYLNCHTYEKRWDIVIEDIYRSMKSK